MANLKAVDRMFLEAFFEMKGGFVLSFSNSTLHDFVRASTGEDIFAETYAVNGGSKARRMRAFWTLAPDGKVAVLLDDLLTFMVDGKKIECGSAEAARVRKIVQALRGGADEAGPAHAVPRPTHGDGWHALDRGGSARQNGPAGDEASAAASASPSPTEPTAFLSYSWDSEEHRSWVRDLAARLRADGVNAILDRWAVVPGDQIPSFMERACTASAFVLIVCTPNYKSKSDRRKGGVGYEGDIMTAEVLRTGNHRKFIPILRGGDDDSSLPTWLAGKYRVDLRGTLYAPTQYEDLVCTLHGSRPVAPPVAATPPPFARPRADSAPAIVAETAFARGVGPIRIEGVIVDEVGNPRNDGTRGSALYKVPFRLSRQPPAGWGDAFVQAWDHPSSYTTSHRPGIARVVGNKVILDGTTMDEVADVHRETLLLAVAEANRLWDEFEERKRRREAELSEQREAHRKSVEDAAKRIRFDP